MLFGSAAVNESCARSVVVLDGNLTMEFFAERDYCLCAANAEGLELAVDKVEKMLVVAGIHLDEDVVFTGGEMTFYDLGNFLYFLHDFVETRRVIKEKADVGACVVTDCFMVDDCFKSLDYAGSEKLLDALVYCSTGYITLACNLQKRLSGIAR